MNPQARDREAAGYLCRLSVFVNLRRFRDLSRQIDVPQLFKPSSTPAYTFEHASAQISHAEVRVCKKKMQRDCEAQSRKIMVHTHTTLFFARLICNRARKWKRFSKGSTSPRSRLPPSNSTSGWPSTRALRQPPRPPWP